MLKNTDYSSTSKKGGEQTKKRNGIGFYKKIGKKGGLTTKERYDSEYFSKIGRKGGIKRHTNTLTHK